MMAKPPSPPVRLPRLPSSVKVQPPTVVLLTTVQPGGAVGASNVAAAPMKLRVYPGALHESTSTDSGTSCATSAVPAGMFTSAVRYPG